MDACHAAQRRLWDAVNAADGDTTTVVHVGDLVSVLQAAIKHESLEFRLVKLLQEYCEESGRTIDASGDVEEIDQWCHCASFPLAHIFDAVLCDVKEK